MFFQLKLCYIWFILVKMDDLWHNMNKKPENETAITGTHRGNRCHGCMPMRNQSHHHTGERMREKKQWDKDEWVWNGTTHLRNRHSYLMLAVQFLKKKRTKKNKRQKKMSWGKMFMCPIQTSITVLYSSNSNNTFILGHIQYFIYGLWETHAVFLCGCLVGTGEKNNSYRHNSKKRRFNLSWPHNAVGTKTSHHGHRLLGDQF